jgi:hypothetical protein
LQAYRNIAAKRGCDTIADKRVAPRPKDGRDQSSISCAREGDVLAHDTREH